MIRRQTCPVCRKKLEGGAESETFPFCSERCRRIDYFRWSDGKYAIVDPLSPEDLSEIDESEFDRE